jgi:hypothetical protein
MGKFLCCLLSFLFSMQMQSVAQCEPHWTLDDLVSEDTLGKTQKYVEFKIGSPAVRESTDHSGIKHSQYEIGKCRAFLDYKKGEVVSVSMYVSANCDLDVSKRFRVPGAKLSQTTFENWTHVQPQSIRFVDPILDHCNSCGELPGAARAIFPSAHVTGWVATVLTGGAYTDEVFLKGLEVWKEKLHQAGIDGQQLYDKHLKSSMGICPQEQFDDLALRSMGKGRVDGIKFRQDDRFLCE